LAKVDEVLNQVRSKYRDFHVFLAKVGEVQLLKIPLIDFSPDSFEKSLSLLTRVSVVDDFAVEWRLSVTRTMSRIKGWIIW
jgi:hypothetical protein